MAFQHFGKVKSKFEGAKDAIEAIVTDSSLTMVQILDLDIGIQECLTVMGAHKIGGMGGEVYCHHYGDCQYYDMDRNEITGKSNPCLGDYWGD